MRTHAKLFLACLATSFAATPVNAGCKSTTEIVVELSGGANAIGKFDKNKKDFDVLRELVLLAGLEGALSDPSDGGLDGITVFGPWDNSFYRLARNLGYKGAYNEEEFFGFLATTLTDLAPDGDLKALVTSILQYHVGNEEIVFKRLAKMGKKRVTVTTLLDNAKIPVKMAMKTSNSKMRMKMEHNANPKNFPYPKIQNKLADIETCNGRLNVIKDVLIPL